MDEESNDGSQVIGGTRLEDSEKVFEDANLMTHDD